MSRIPTISAIGISLLALTVSLWQGWTAREHNRLSVKPYLQVTPYLEGQHERVGLYISNYGLGPAVIENATLSLDSRPHDLTKNSWQEALQQIAIDDLCFRKSWLPRESILANDREVPLLSVSSGHPSTCLIELINLLSNHDIALTVEYRSLYGERLKNTFQPRLPTAGDEVLRALERLQP